LNFYFILIGLKFKGDQYTSQKEKRISNKKEAEQKISEEREK